MPSRFNVDANCNHCADVPTNCRKCGKEYPKQLLARACEIRHHADDRLTTTQVADLIGVKPATWRAYVSRRQAPKPDGQFDARTPYWFQGTIDGWRPKA